ncbi:MAG: hypothetical protein ACJ735_12740 [Actinomycetes bacterium]
MRRRAVIAVAVLVTGGILGALAPLASAAPTAKLPPVCLSHPLPHHLNVQVGYCP